MSYPTMLTWQPSFLEGGGGIWMWDHGPHRARKKFLWSWETLPSLTTFLMSFRAERSSYIENIIQH